MSIDPKYTEFWENCRQFYAHLREHAYVKCKDIYTRALSLVDIEGKTVIDYGCGGGWTGRMMSERGIGKYIGIDIAERSLNFARRTMGGHPGAEFYLAPINLAKIAADALVCFSVIQHMPKAVMHDFLKNLDGSGIPLLLLHVRHAEKTQFNDAYNEGGSIGHCCLTNGKYVSERLKNYKLAAHREEPDVQFLVFKRKDADRG
jgi:SAM-dependent methyltransferase